MELLLPTAAEVPETARLLNEPSVSRYTLHIPYPYRERHGRDWVRIAAKGRRTGRSLGLTVVRRADGAILGGVGLDDISENDSAELGYWIGREHRGKGYASEAVDLMVRTGFRRLGLFRIEALVFPANAASRRVLKKCGFRFEGRLRGEAWKNGRWQTTLLFARLRTDPPVRR